MPPFPRITGLHAYLLFFIVIVFAISFDYIIKENSFRTSGNGHINHAVIGIELGRSYSRVATFRDHLFEMIVDEQGRSKIPSIIRFPELRSPLIRFKAEDQSHDDPRTTIRDVNFLLRRQWSNPKLQASIENLPYDVVAKDSQVSIKVPINGTDAYFTAEEILSYQLTHLKNIAEAYLNQAVNDAVISVPTYFNSTQEDAVNRAAISAGLSVKLLISEARAAGDAYHIDSIVTRRGQGEEDVSDYFLIYNIDQEESSIIVKQYLRGDYRTVGSLDDRIPPCSGIETPPLHREWSSGRTITLIEQILRMAQIDQRNITGIVIAGDSSHIDSLQSILESFFSSKKVLKDEIFEHDQAVVYGAASVAYRLSDDYHGTFPYLLDMTSLNLGIQSQGDVFLKVISEDVAIPTREKQVVTTTTNDKGNVVISVYQGKSLVASENQFLGSIELDTLSMGPKVEVEVEMLFEVDVNGALTVVGTEKKSKSKKEAKFVASTTLNR